MEPGRVPTRANLMRALRWLVDGASAGDSLVFHFSGHGVQKLDRDGDEADGYDEALCPVDFEDPRGGGGVILDDEINATIVRPLGKGVKLHAIVDTCHSGTILDLPYLCRLSRYVRTEHPWCHTTVNPPKPKRQGQSS
jgi:metacaspase-1